MSTGTVETFDPQRGFGFIRDDADPDGSWLFVYFLDIEMDGFKIVYPGDVVSFRRTKGPKGLRAVNVRAI